MKKLKPFNIDLYFATNNEVRNLRPTTRTDIYEGVTSNFNDEGLFSTITFGRQGTEERDKLFSYIRLNCRVIHPAVFEVVKKIKRLYVDIMSGKAYAKWDDKVKDFVPSDLFDGSTGYAFFTEHLHELNPPKNKSNKRTLYIDVLNRYQKQCLMYNSIVLPAGLRDVYVDKNGRETQDEINDLYRKLISISNNINMVGGMKNDPSIDTQRYNLQRTMNDIYVYLTNMLSGKKGLIQAKWGGRKVINGTRNVASSMNMLAKDLRDTEAVSVNTAHCSLLECIVAAMPITIHHLKRKFLDHCFRGSKYPAVLINRKSLQSTEVMMDPKIYDKWGTVKGIEKRITGFALDELRNKPIIISGHYVALIWMSPKKDKFKVLWDISQLPEGATKEQVHPLTYGELFYLCNYEGWYDLKGDVTRYPIAGMYSIFPANIYVKTTLDAFECNEINDEGEVIGRVREYPNIENHSENNWFNTMSVNSVKLAALVADKK